MLMLQDDSGEIFPTRLDPGLVASDKAIIVLDEYADTCWVWVGRDVNMPTRMHALRMGKSVQKSGYKIGVTTIGMASTRIIEMLEKDDSDSEVASNIVSFREALQVSWKFEDEFLAFDASKAPVDASPAPMPGAPEVTFAPATTQTPEPVSVPETPVSAPAPVKLSTGPGETKTAFLLYSTVKHADLVYTERFERDGKLGLKIEAPGTMVLEVIVDGDNLRFDPANFGDTEGAQAIKAEFESWLSKI
ncbi:MAG: hypothetical protein RTU30_02940 [Candidatus Thorarchaeota archaeon]